MGWAVNVESMYGRGGGSHGTPNGLAVAVGALLVLAACACAPEANDGVGGSESAARGSSLVDKGTTAPRPQDCSQPRRDEDLAGEWYEHLDVFDEESLRDSDRYLRLPPEFGLPLRVARVGSDVVLLEDRDDDLWVHRITASGSTVGEARLGPASRSSLYGFTPADLRIVDGSIIVGWVAGESPDGESAPAATSVQYTALDEDLAARTSDVMSLRDLDREGEPPPLLALSPDGGLLVGLVQDSVLTVHSFGDDGAERWSDSVRGSGSDESWTRSQGLAAPTSDLVVGTIGGEVTAWHADGSPAWDRSVAESDYVNLAGVDQGHDPLGVDGGPAVTLVLGGRSEEVPSGRFWVCVLDTDGSPMLVADLGADPHYDPGYSGTLRSWWRDELVFLSEMVTLEVGYRITSVSPEGFRRRAISLGGSGDIVPSEGSSIADVFIDETGSMVIAGGVTSRVAVDRGIDGNFDHWTYVVLLDPPDGDDPLKSVPIQ